MTDLAEPVRYAFEAPTRHVIRTRLSQLRQSGRLVEVPCAYMFAQVPTSVRLRKAFPCPA